MPRPKVAWRPEDDAAPPSQGDLVLVAWTKTIAPEDATHRDQSHPALGARDAFDLCFWEERRDQSLLEMWGRACYSLAVIISESCAIDKEFNTLVRAYQEEGCDLAEAIRKAEAQEEGYVSVAEAWPVEALPEHLQSGAASGAVGYIPFSLGNLVPSDDRNWIVDLSRVSTVRLSSIHRRLGIADGRWVLRLQSGICRYYAARTIRVTADLTEIFDRAVISVEALAVSPGNPPRARVRLHFDGGQKIDLEAVVPGADAAVVEQPEGPRRPGLRQSA